MYKLIYSSGFIQFQEQKNDLYSNEEIVIYLQAWRLRHGLTNLAFEDIIQFIAILTGKLDGPLDSLYLFDKLFSSLAPFEPIKVHFFCTTCFMYYEKEIVPQNCSCGAALPKDKNQFIYTSRKTIIKYLLQFEENKKEILR